MRKLYAMNNLIFIVVAKLIAAKILKRQSELRMVPSQKIQSWLNFLKRKQTDLRQLSGPISERLKK